MLVGCGGERATEKEKKVLEEQQEKREQVKCSRKSAEGWNAKRKYIIMKNRCKWWINYGKGACNL